MFNLNDLSESPKSKYLTKGVNHNVEIVKVESLVSSSGNPMVKVFFNNADNDDSKVEDARGFQFVFMNKVAYNNKSIFEVNMEKLLHINNAVAKKQQFIDICQTTGVDGSHIPTETEVEQFTQMLNSLWSGKCLRMLFSQREYLNDKNEVKSTIDIPLPPFVESISDNAEYPSVLNNNTKLVFDENRHVKKLTIRPDSETQSSFENSVASSETQSF